MELVVGENEGVTSLAPDILAVARVAPDRSRVDRAKAEAEAVKRRLQDPTTGTERRPLAYPLREEGAAEVSIYGTDFAAPFKQGDDAGRIIDLVREKIEVGLSPNEIFAGAESSFRAERDKIRSGLQQAEKEYDRVRLVSQDEIELSQGFGVVFHSDWQGQICDDGLIVYRDGTRLRYTHYYQSAEERGEIRLDSSDRGSGENRRNT